ncbi:hypothetical protein [Streptomyces sp. NPDC086519]|uniref:hypothetical protein n=1 Tax=Streptomyces sp. NPDC086519 TaxID=3154863 RepID=UPI003448188E
MAPRPDETTARERRRTQTARTTAHRFRRIRILGTIAHPIVKECERRLARYQAALEAGADPAVVTQWINEAQADTEAARKNLDTPPAATRKKETPLSADQIREITERLGDIAQRMQAVDAEKKSPLYEALGITISYGHADRAVTVRSRPSSTYRYSEWVVHEIL